LEHTRGKLDKLEFNPEANEEYDENLAKIGREQYDDDEVEKDE
jgi:hypothetical protein